MESRNLLPQNTRMMANLLSFSGGALDVFCHMYYHSLVATQTGNILLLVCTITCYDAFPSFSFP